MCFGKVGKGKARLGRQSLGEAGKAGLRKVGLVWAGLPCAGLEVRNWLTSEVAMHMSYAIKGPTPTTYGLYFKHVPRVVTE